MFYDTCEGIYEQAYAEKDYEYFNMEILIKIPYFSYLSAKHLYII